MNTLVRAGTDLTEARNLIVASVILVFGVGGMPLALGEFRLEGIGLAGMVAVLLNATHPRASGGRARPNVRADSAPHRADPRERRPA